VPGGFIYLETGRPLDRSADGIPLPPGWIRHRQGRAGAVHFELLRREQSG
jgi:hypothetical protein